MEKGDFEERYERWADSWERRSQSEHLKKLADSYLPTSAWEFPPDDEIEHEYPSLIPLREQVSHKIGDTLIAAVINSEAAVYRLRHGENCQGVQIHSDTMNAWFDSLAAVPRCMKYFVRLDNWASLQNFPRVKELGEQARLRSTNSPSTPPIMDGRSFGLAFSLSIASCVVKIPLPTNLAGLACCDAFGRLEPVESLEEKLLAIRRDTPRVKRIIISEEQEGVDEPRTGVFKHFSFVRLSRLRAAFETAFPQEELEEKLREWVRDEEAASLVEQLLHYVLFERERPSSLSPISSTADLVSRRAEELQAPLNSEQHMILRFIKAVAWRRDGSEKIAATSLPRDTHWATDFPEWMQIHILSEYCQQAYDTGTPSVRKIKTIFESSINQWCIEEDPANAAFDELRLLSSWWRVAEHEGHFLESLQAQTRIAEQWVLRRFYEESTRPLARAIVLAGALRNEEYTERLKSTTSKTLAYLDRESIGHVYVRLAQFRMEVVSKQFSRARQLLGQMGPEEVARLPLHILLCRNRHAIRIPENINNKKLWKSLLDAAEEEGEYSRIATLLDSIRRGDNRFEIKSRVNDLCDASKQFQSLYEAVATSPDTPVFGENDIVERAQCALDFYPY